MNDAKPGDAGVYPWLEGHWSFFLQRLENENLAHALMIEGPEGIGKTALARAMVGRLLCLEDQGVACGHCRSCGLLAGTAHPDYFDLQPEEDSEVIKVDQVRAVIGKLNLTTSISKRKVAFIHPAESMNIAAANALLKSLEEPVGDTVLILVSDNPGRLPITIRSRCQSICVSQPGRQTVMDWLEQHTENTREQLETALQAAGNSPLLAKQYLGSSDLEAYGQVRAGLAKLLGRPASVSLVSSEMSSMSPVDLWRWLSNCTGEVIKSVMLGQSLGWLPTNLRLSDKSLLELQKKADINRQLSSTPVRADLLLQDWLIRWAELVI